MYRGVIVSGQQMAAEQRLWMLVPYSNPISIVPSGGVLSGSRRTCCYGIGLWRGCCAHLGPSSPSFHSPFLTKAATATTAKKEEDPTGHVLTSATAQRRMMPEKLWIIDDELL